MLELNKLYNMDCLEGMKYIDDKSIDMILCDLPYGTTACKWDTIIPFDKLWNQYNRVIKDNGAILLFAQTPFDKVLGCSNIKNLRYEWIWEMTTVRANKEHPAMFPVELPWRCIKMHSDKGGIVLEPFSGSGTTIIAAEQTERKCYAMELSPVYCDLAVERWENHTGQKAVLAE